MRLSQQDKRSIKSIISNFDPQAEVYIFGSRADPLKKGGDIDILVISTCIKDADRRRIKVNLYDALGEQKIDLLIVKDLTDNFAKHAFETGIKL